MDLKETYNKIAEEWHQDHQQDDWWVEGTDAFVSLLKSGSSVLDVGCGAGTKSKYLTSKGLNVTGVDFSENMIEIAKREVSEVKFQVLDLADVHTLHELFDGIFMQAVLLHVPKAEAQKQIAQIATRLKDGGYFYVAVKEKWADSPEEEIKTEDDYGYPYQRFFSYFSLDEIRGYFTNSGLKVVYKNISSAGKTNWIQVIAQK